MQFVKKTNEKQEFYGVGEPIEPPRPPLKQATPPN
jgi:hypothetical protein